MKQKANHNGLEIEFEVDTIDGYFEAWDVKSNGFHYYIAGELEIEDRVLWGYDGVFQLPQYIIDAVKNQGVTIQI